MKRLFETSLAGVVALSLSMCAVFVQSTSADEPGKARPKAGSVPPSLVELSQAVVDTVLEHHIDPPARQQMFLSGIKALYKAAGSPVPEGLSRRVSMASRPEQIAKLLQDTWPDSISESVTAEKLESALLDGLLTSVSGDPELILEKERKVREQSEGNRYVGIHVGLAMNNAEKRPALNHVIEGGPADRARLQTNDVIVKIEGTDTKGMTLSEAVDLLRGDEGTSVTIEVRRPGTSELRTCTLKRGQHPRATIRGWRKQGAEDWDFRIIASEPIAYVRIVELAASTPHELRKIARRLESDGTKAIVIDLRGLWTTSAHTAVLLADSLLDHGVIGRVRSAHGETTYEADADAVFRGLPIAVLVDENTAGASEWLAAAIQDNRRGMVIGSPTASARLDPGPGIVTSAKRVGTTEWSVSLATGVLERADGKPISSFERSIRTLIREPKSKSTGVHPDHVAAVKRQLVAMKSTGSEGEAVAGSQGMAGVESIAPAAPDSVQRKAIELLGKLLKKS